MGIHAHESNAILKAGFSPGHAGAKMQTLTIQSEPRRLTAPG